MTVSKITNAPTQKELIDKTNEIIDNLGGGGGSSTDVQINGTSITSQGVANILTNTAYNASSNKIATMSDIPSTSGLANTDLSNLSATGEAHFLKNTATGTNALTINGTTSAYNGSINIGYQSNIGASGGVALGYQASATGYSATAIGGNASASYASAIQIGYGTNSNAKTLSIGFWDSPNPTNWTLLNGTTGLIPDDRLSTNIQRTSTAVTHTANTQVGDSSTPVYINSSGVATSTGLSIASSRFDGQWVKVTTVLSSAGAKGTYDLTSAVASVLPNDNYCYELLIDCVGNSSAQSEMYLSSSLVDEFAVIYCTTNSRIKTNTFIMPVDVTRTLTSKITTNNFSIGASVNLRGYRRIGTNS